MKFFLTASAVCICLLLTMPAQAEHPDFVQVIRDHVPLREAPAPDAKIIATAHTGWFLHVDSFSKEQHAHTGPDNTKWYAIWEINHEGSNDPTGFWYVHLMYQPHDAVFVNVADVEPISDPYKE